MNAPLIRIPARQTGFSLVELMVAMVLGLVLTGGVINIYISSKQTYRMQDNQSRLQENGRFALQYLTKDLRMAGYTGCNNMDNIPITNIANPTPGPAPVFNFGTVVQGYDAGAGAWPASFPTQPTNLAPNTSGIMVRYAAASGVCVDQPLPLPTATIHVTSNPYGWTADTVLFITDCSRADIFRANSISNAGTGVNINHSTAANSTNALSKSYGTDAQVMAFNSSMYYIGSMAGGTNTACPCALFRQKFSTAPAEQLVDNVQNMQITYGVVTSYGPNTIQYLPACPTNSPACVSVPPTLIQPIPLTPPNWANVVSARVNLLVTTPDNNLVDTPQSYFFNGVKTTAADRRLYSSFSDTITFRNRTP